MSTFIIFGDPLGPYFLYFRYMNSNHAYLNYPSQPSPAAPYMVATANHVSKVYGDGQGAVTALRDVSLGIAPGEFVAIMGPSGSGKSTLMNCMAGLDSVTSGQVAIAGQPLNFANDNALTELRRERIGFIFQSFNLVPTLNVVENIELPFLLAGRGLSPEERAWSNQLINHLGLRDRVTHRPSQLSGGQRQRVAIARALVMKPAVIFADEPTGSLDTRSSREVLELLQSLSNDMGQSIVMVTHNPIAAAVANRIVVISDGRIVQELGRTSSSEISDLMIKLEESL